MRISKMVKIVFILCLGLLLVVNTGLARNKNINKDLKQNLQKPAEFNDVIINIGKLYCYFSNSSLLPSGEENYGFNIGDDVPYNESMVWLEGGYADNLYLYFGVHRMSVGDEEVHFSGLQSEDWQVLRDDPEAKSAFQVSWSMDDVLAGSYSKNISASIMIHAWSEGYRDDFYIMEYDVTNNGAEDITDFYGWWHMDCDISGVAGGSGVNAFYRDDMPSYYLGTDKNGNPEHLSYMFDADNPNIPGDDTGGMLTPKESLGFIGSRIIDCPPRTGEGEETANTQSGHQWWDWNSDPDINIIGENASLAMKQEFKADPGSPHDYRYMQIIGPLTIEAGATIHYAIGMGIGEGLDGLRANLQWAYDLYWNDFIGPAAPAAPAVSIDKGDGFVKLTWNDQSENSLDPLTLTADFEGYRIYRSLDKTNWALLADYDKVNGYGYNTGLPEKNADGMYEYLDESVVNGFVYYYTVSAYDRGGENLEPLETGKRADIYAEPGPIATSTKIDEDAIRVVPNPFVVNAPWDFTPTQENPSEERLQFQNIPLGAKITVFNLAGDKIIELEQQGTDGYVNWDLITRNTQKVVSGTYLYVVEADGDSFIDKFVVIR